MDSIYNPGSETLLFKRSTAQCNAIRCRNSVNVLRHPRKICYLYGNCSVKNSLQFEFNDVINRQ